MSIDAVTAVLNDPRPKGSAKLVLISLAWHANSEGLAWPSQTTMARHASVSLRQVRYDLAILVALGLIVPVKRLHHRPVIWRLCFLTGTPLPDTEAVTGNPLPDTEAVTGNPLPLTEGSNRQCTSGVTGNGLPPNLHRTVTKESTTTGEQGVVEAWNDLATELGLARVSQLTKRRRELLTSIIDAHGLEGWRLALEAIRRSPFLRGDNPKGFKPTFDWLLGEDAFARVIEGGYDGWKDNGANGANGGGAVKGVDSWEDLQGKLSEAEIEVLRRNGTTLAQLRANSIDLMRLDAVYAYLKAHIGRDEALDLCKTLSFEQAEAYLAERGLS